MGDVKHTYDQASKAMTFNAGTDKVPPEYIKPKKYLCFSEAHEFAKSLNFKTRKEWRLYVKGGMAGKKPMPENIPAHPDGIYRLKGWQGWKFWLGTANQGIHGNKLQ